MRLQRNLKRILADRDLTAAQLSRKSGVPKATIGDWLAGGIPRDLRKVKLVTDFLGLTVDELCFGEGRASEEPIEQHLEEIRAGLFEVILRRPKDRGQSE